MTDVVVILGSKSDKEVAKKAIKIFDQFGIEYAITVASAHRTPARLAEIIDNAHKNGVKVFIAIAGLSAHLPGVARSVDRQGRRRPRQIPVQPRRIDQISWMTITR